MSLYSEIDRLLREENVLKQQIESLKAKEGLIKNNNVYLSNDSNKEQAKVLAEQRGLLEAKLVEKTKLRELNEEALKVIEENKENKNINENRGEVDTQQSERDKIVNKHIEREENMQTFTGVAEEQNQVIEGKQGADPLVAAAVLGVATVKIVKDFIEKDTKNNVSKEWENEIDKKEQAVNEKFDKEVKETEKSLQKQLDYIEKKLDDKNEKLNKQNELKDTINKVKDNIEKDRNTELENLKVERASLDKIQETTKSMNEKDRQNEIKRLREVERQREIERQRQLSRNR